jgi:gliding motility-associated protein GldL
MGKSKFNIVAALQRWMDSVPGQTFLNYAYSWGASVVILGTLFKLTHIKGADVMLFLGMGTEVFVFFLSAFDRPFDKQADKEDLLNEEQMQREVAENLGFDDDEEETSDATSETAAAASAPIVNGPVYSGPIYVGGPAYAATGAPVEGSQSSESVAPVNAGVASVAPQQPLPAGVSPEMAAATEAYVEQLKALTETLTRVSEQASRLITDSDEMNLLNRTLTGINSVYEIQLKSVSMQVGTIDAVNEQTRKMAQQIEELNGVYSRMIKALTINMKNASSEVGL